MPKKQTKSMQTIGYLLLWGGIILLIGRACTFFLSLNNVVSPPVSSSPPQPGLTSASVDNGIIYFTANNTIHALRTGDGKQIWQAFSNAINPPIVANGIVYEVDFREITALRGSDGTFLWRYFPTDQGDAAQPGNTQIAQIVGDRIYVYDGQVLNVLIAESGIQAWSANEAAYVVDIKTLTISNGIVYYAIHHKNDATTTSATTTAADAILARRAADGKLLWTYSATVAGQPCAITSTAQALDTIYASTTCNNGTGRTFALRASDGVILWQSSVSGPFTVANGAVCLHITQASPALVDLYVLQASTGKQLWSFQQDQFNLTWSIVSIDATTDTISIQGLDTQHPTDLYLLRATDGELMGSIIQSQEVNTVIIANGQVYLTSIHGDGNDTPFSYHLETFRPENEGNKMLWEFGA